MHVRRGARFLAPIALVAVVVALYVIVHGQLGKTQVTTTTSTSATNATRVAQPASTTGSTSTTPRTYVVKANDTYSSIATKTGVSIAQLEALNPKVSANSLHLGERIVISH